MKTRTRATRNETPLYEREILQQITGKTLRPGGLRTTLASLAYCNFKPTASLLDVGCGMGETLRLLTQKGYRALGIDTSTMFLQKARTHSTVIRASMQNMPFTCASFDGFFCECVLSLSDQKAHVLQELYRITRTGGYGVISDITLPEGARQKISSTVSCIQGAQPLTVMLDLAKQAGFTVHTVSDHTRLLQELAAKMVLHCGSMQNFWDIWQMPFAPQHNTNARNRCIASCSTNMPPQKLLYHLIILKKE